MLEYFITSKTKRSLLKLFLTNPERPFYIREIARLTVEPVNAVRRELNYLEKAGLLKSLTQGNQKYYSVVKEFPFFSELKKIIYGTIALGDYLRDRLAGSEEIKLAFIYGSVASNKEIEKSDIDLMVVGEINEDELHHIILAIEKDIGRQVNYTLMSRDEWMNRRKNKEPFITRILSEKKIVLIGDPDVFR